MKETLGNHRWAIILALLVTVIVALPQIYFRIDHKDDGIYQGIELLPDSPWSARAREVQDGHPLFGNIYNKEGKDNPYLFQPLGSIVVGYMGEMFSLDINNTLLLSRLVLTPIVFLLIYAFVFLISRDKFAGLCSASLLLLADGIMSYYGLSHILQGISPENFLRIARPVNPAMIYVLFFGFLVTFWLFYKRRGWGYGAVSAVLLGLNFYNYFYTWTYLYAFGALLVLFFLVQRNWKEAVRIGSVFVGALLVGVPYLINLYQVTLHPAYEEVGARFGLLISHAPLFVGFVVMVGVVVYLLGFPRKDRETYLFGLALTLTPFITMNQQLLTGKVLQTSHYHWFFHKPMAVIFVLVVVFHVLSKNKLSSYTRLLLALVTVTMSLAVGLFIQVDSYYNGDRDGGMVAIERQKYGPVMRWLGENAERDAVVFGNDTVSHMTVIYTPLNVFYHRALPFASLSATYARQLDTMFSFFRLRGIENPDAREVFFKERKTVSIEMYGIYYRELNGTYESIPDNQVEEVLAHYEEALKTPAPEWLENVWRKYGVTYVVWDKKSDPTWQIENLPFLEEVAVFGDLSIYKLASGV